MDINDIEKVKVYKKDGSIQVYKDRGLEVLRTNMLNSPAYGEENKKSLLSYSGNAGSGYAAGRGVVYKPSEIDPMEIARQLSGK